MEQLVHSEVGSLVYHRRASSCGRVVVGRSWLVQLVDGIVGVRCSWLVDWFKCCSRCESLVCHKRAPSLVMGWRLVGGLGA